MSNQIESLICLILDAIIAENILEFAEEEYLKIASIGESITTLEEFLKIKINI